MFKKSLSIPMLGLVVLAGPMWGTTVVYCNESSACGADTEAAFTTATDSLSFATGLEDFAYSNGAYSSGLTDVDSITGLDVLGYDGATQKGVTILNDVVKQTVNGNGTSLEVLFPAGVYAFGAMISDASTAAYPCVASDSGWDNCNNQLTITSSSDVEFVGFVSDSPLTGVFIGTNTSAGPLSIKSFELGQQADPDTPEMGTMLLIGSGLIFLRFIRRRQVRFEN